MQSYLDTIQLELPQSTDTGKARYQVLSSLPWAPTPTTNVSYVSSNRVLVVGDLQTGQSITDKLGERLQVFIAVPSEDTSTTILNNARNVVDFRIKGYLGRFSGHNGEPDLETDANNFGKLLGIQNGLFDHVIDCGSIPLIAASIKPPGYYFVGDDPAKLEDALEQVPALIGEFEKPKFFDYNPDICAHSRSGIDGCRRCIDACPTDAIISIGEQIEVDPHLCQGGGTCTASCPSGAISYRYPNAEEQIEFIRLLIRDYRALTSNKGVALLVYDNEHGAELVSKHQSSLPEHILPLMVEEIGSVGLDLLASCMAYGVTSLDLLVPRGISNEVVTSLQRDIDLLESVLDQLGLVGYRLGLVNTLDPVLTPSADQIVIDSVATYAGIGNKRSIIRSAMQAFNVAAKSEVEQVSLPEGSIFGEVTLNSAACTLCMGCVSVCPGSALEAGGESPALKFIEANCLQCGICTRACPESALELVPRFLFDTASANRNRVLKEEEPFRCIKCNKPFATQAMVSRITEKLTGHWMFETPEAINRLRMCEDCRVADMYDRKDMIG